MSTAKIDYVADWNKRLLGRLYWQFRNKPKWRLWTALLARQFQDLEDAIQALLTLVSIDDSIGAQLDNLGRFVGQPRAGVDDATYRLYLKARVVANKSNGTPEWIYRVLTALFGASTGFIYKPGFVKQFAIRIVAPITGVQALVAANFLGDAKEAGARAVLQWQESPDAALFRFDSGPGFDSGVFACAVQA